MYFKYGLEADSNIIFYLKILPLGNHIISKNTTYNNNGDDSLDGKAKLLLINTNEYYYD